MSEHVDDKYYYKYTQGIIREKKMLYRNNNTVI